MNVAVVDYGMGNVGSIQNMLRKVGATAEITADPGALAGAPAIIIPGVGAFDAGIRALRRSGLDALLAGRVRAGVPLLGICLGMQLLGRASEEGVDDGLGWLAATTVRIEPDDDDVHVPHIGWTAVSGQASPLFEGLDPGTEFYFMHSYEVRCDDPTAVVATCDHGGHRTAAIQQGNLLGVQFHPEKSHDAGMALFRNFLALAA